MSNNLVRKIATATALFAWTYFALVLLLGRSIGRFYFGLDLVALSLPIVGVGVYFAARFAVARGAGGVILRLSIASFFLVGCLLVADVLYAVYGNSRTEAEPTWNDGRLFDPSLTVGELYPPRYFPTSENFRLLKPNVSVSGAHRGEYYSPKRLESPDLASVFTEYQVSCTTDAHGFRNETPIDAAGIFALGDSFTFGWAVDAEDSWVGKLQRALGRPIYNLGIPGTSPKQELELLEYVLRSDSVRIRRLLWMIYEGNDLDDSYAEKAPARASVPGEWEHLTEGTILQGLEKLPWRIQKQSILHRIVARELVFRRQALDPSSPDGETADGAGSSFTVFDSPELGPRLFFSGFVEQAAAPASWVLDHPNRPSLDAVFEEMAHLAAADSFDVTVIIVPTAARLHGPHYDGFPQVTEPSPFASYVNGLSEQMGFRSLDLLPFFAPYGGRELLYLRDDEHWNRRGNAVTAEIIERQIFP